MTTALDIITDAMQECGVLTKDETPTNSEAQSGLAKLNRLMGAWSNTGKLAYERVTESFTLSSGVASYTIGSGATFDTTRPMKIVEAHVRQDSTDYQLTLVNDKVFQSISYKNVGSIPELLNYTNEYPTGTINLYPEPATAYTLFITSEKPLTTFATTATSLDLPPGWEEALTYNLAVRMCGTYGRPISPDLKGLARESKAMISLGAIRNNPLQSQVPNGRTTSNIYSGYYR